MFLNPIFLWALPVALLPIIIHLLNRLRYRTVNWAAMMFLISATRSSTRNARLRHWLILLCRTLALLLFLLALARPLVGGWFGSTLAGAPDTILILLDRSASMEATDPRRNLSKRAHALNKFAGAGAEAGGHSRYVLIENVLMTPQELAGPDALPELSTTGPTDTAADIPAMMQTALDYMIENQTGRTEIWIASDLQMSNWRPGSDSWSKVTAQLDALPQSVRVRLLSLSDETLRNVSVDLKTIERRSIDGRPGLAVALNLERSQNAEREFPLSLMLDGGRRQVMLTMESPVYLHHEKFELPTGQDAGGWGLVELPADENLRDNRSYFVYGGDVHLKGAVVSEDTPVSKILRLATAPAPKVMDHSCEIVSRGAINVVEFDKLAMLTWQTDAPTETDAVAIRQFVEEGGTLILFPPGSPDVPGPMGIRWGVIEKAESEEKPYRISLWEENEGPLARTENGENLPVAALNVGKRQSFQTDESAEESDQSEWTALARYTDGTPFLSRRLMGRGRVLVCTTLPEKSWSTLTEGLVLVPMMQRLLRQGGGRLMDARGDICGQWFPETSDEIWTVEGLEEGETPRDYRWEAGVYRSGDRRVALNRPVVEDEPQLIDKDEASGLFGNLRVQVLEEKPGKERDAVTSEIWPMLVYIALMCLVIESGLLLSERTALDRDAHRTKKMKEYRAA